MLQHWWLKPDWVLLLVGAYHGIGGTMVSKKGPRNKYDWGEFNGYLIDIGWLKVIRQTHASFWYVITERGKQALAYEMGLYYLKDIKVEELGTVADQYEEDVYTHGFNYDAWIKPVEDRIEVHARTLLASWDGLIPVDADDTHPLFQAWLETHLVPKYTHWAILSKAYQLQFPQP